MQSVSKKSQSVGGLYFGNIPKLQKIYHGKTKIIASNSKNFTQLIFFHLRTTDLEKKIFLLPIHLFTHLLTHLTNIYGLSRMPSKGGGIMMGKKHNTPAFVALTIYQRTGI